MPVVSASQVVGANMDIGIKLLLKELKRGLQGIANNLCLYQMQEDDVVSYHAEDDRQKMMVRGHND